MAFRTLLRHVASALIVTLFALGVGAQGFAATGVALKMSQPDAAQTQAADDAMDCCGDKQVTPACVAACAVASAILCEPAALPTIILPQNVSMGIEIAPAGRCVPPEPDPPRTICMR
jgi:hypothetical protein